MIGAHYTASEDSAFFRKALGDLSGGCCLEIGAGNGGNLTDLSGRFGLVVGTDLERPAMSDWKESRANYILADAASCIRPSVFDLVAFNPPYLPSEIEDRTVDGGTKLQVPKQFLVEALRVVKGTGKVVFLLNQEADLREFEKICALEGFDLKRVASKASFYEELLVYVAARQSLPIC